MTAQGNALGTESQSSGSPEGAIQPFQGGITRQEFNKAINPPEDPMIPEMRHGDHLADRSTASG